MAQVNLTQGAELAGVGRSTFMRHLKEGKISKGRDDDGKPYVDTADILRVYGALQSKEQVEQVSMASHETPKTEHRRDSVQIEIDLLRERLTDKDDVIADLRKRLDQAADERARLLADLRPVPSEQHHTSAQPPRERAGGLFGWFGRAGR